MYDTSSKYMSLLTDYGFKAVFGDKELLLSFLNALFEKEGKTITSVSYINKEMTPQNKQDRVIFYDVLCKTNKGESFILEMQHKPQDTFRDRAIYYISRAIDDQGRNKKNWNYKIRPVCGVFITNFHLRDVQMPDVPVTEVGLMNRDTKEVFSDTIRMFFIDLMAFNKTEEECETALDLWIYSIKNSGKMTTAPRMASTSPVFGKLYGIAELAAMPTRKRNQYELSLKHYRDMVSDRETTRNRMKQEREEGIAEGLEKGRISSALRMIAFGVPRDTVLAALGLSAEDIESEK